MSARPMNTDPRIGNFLDAAREVWTEADWIAALGDDGPRAFRALSGAGLPAREVIGFYNTATGERFMRVGSTHGKSDPLGVLRVVHAPSVASLLARAERAILARERALARFKASCACALMGLDFVLLKGLRERRVDRCARLVRESYAEIAALVQGWQELYEKVSGGSR